MLQIKRSFVSIYFTPEKLLVLQLSSKKKLKTKALVALPSGVIRNSQVSDASKLAEILKQVWVEFKFKEKSVGIILPEASSYSKIFKLPKLKISELDEAIRWQAEEYLPEVFSKMILDWKTVGKDEETLDVLVVAVDAPTLMGYVSACEGAGLWPLWVEVPSVCLSRLSKGFGGSLLLYKNFSETLLVLGEDEKILGTSVIYTQSVEEIFKTIQKMIAHFREVEVKNIFVGGSGVTDDLVERLKNMQNLSIKFWKPDIKGLDEAEVQQFLVPISSQLAEIAEPRDPTTLNLLPATVVEKYKHERSKLQVWSLTLTVTLFVWVSFLVTLGTYLFMAQQISALSSEVLKKGSSKVKEEYAKDVSEINAVSQRILKIKEISVSPSLVLNELYSARPQGVAVNAYKMDLDSGRVELSGVSATRDLLIAYKNFLEANPLFSNVFVPISTFEKEANIEFNITLNIASVSSKISPKVQSQIKVP